MTTTTHEPVETIRHTPVMVEIRCSCGHSATALRRDAEEAARGLFQIHQAVARAKERQPESEAG